MRQLDVTSPAVYINKISTAVPPHEVHQRFVDFVPRLLADEREKSMFSRLVKRAQIETRFSCLEAASEGDNLDAEGFYQKNHFPSTAQRMKKYQTHALTLAAEAIAPILSNLDARSISHLVVTSCTGFYAPGLDLEIVKYFAFPRTVERTMIGFMGCYAGINGLKTAFHIVRSEPKAKVLVINLELCTLHLQDNPNFESVLAFLQFADGCAASLISAESHGLKLNSFHCDLIPEDDELIQWHVGNSGFEMRLSLDVPQSLGRKLRCLPPELKESTKIWAIHPGGRSVLDAAEINLKLEKTDLDHSRQVLRTFGNMSSATVMFVLANILADPKLSGPGLGMAFGPGLSLETFCFDKK